MDMLQKKSPLVLAAILSILVLFSTGVWAHCVWIETPMKAQLGQEYSIPVYYADPDDPIEERDLTDLSLYLFTAVGEMLELTLETRETFEDTKMVFSEKGLYTFMAERVPYRYRLQEIRDFGKSFSWVEEEIRFPDRPLGIDLEIVPIEKKIVEEDKHQLLLQVLYDEQPLPFAQIEVFQSLEKEGYLYEEIAEKKGDADGLLWVTIHPSLNYVFETDHRVPAREVEDTGTFITQVRFRSTFFFGAFQ